MTRPEQASLLSRIQDASFARATSSSFPVDRRLDGKALETFLARVGTAVLATVRPDGTPHAAPIGYSLVSSRIVIASPDSAARVRNLRARPHASLVVTEGEGDAHAVALIDGTARLLPALDAPMEMRAPFRGPDGSLPAWVDLLITIAPERLLTYAGPDWKA